MHVVLISECEKKALVRTNLLVGNYAVRVGTRVWASPMTLEGLDALRDALRQSATQQTAVACFQNDCRWGMKLLWVVGSRDKFGADGQAPVSAAHRQLGQACIPPLWMRCASLLAQSAAALHDCGKYTTCPHDPPGKGEASCAREALESLITTHNFTKSSPVRSAAGGQGDGSASCGVLPAACWHTYTESVARLESMTIHRQGAAHVPFWRGCLLLARAALIFADHSAPVLAHRAQDDGTGHHTLAGHVHTVAHTAAHAAWRMGDLARESNASVLEGLSAASFQALLEPVLAGEDSRFQWQNKVAALLERWREAHPDVPCLVFNKAVAGSGTMRMSLRTLCTLSAHEMPRCSLVLPGRNHAPQEAGALCASLGVCPSDMAVVVGDGVTQKVLAGDATCVQQDTACRNAVSMLAPWMEPFFSGPEDQEEQDLVAAPLLVSGVDALNAASEPQTQRQHVEALLRIMTTDLVLDALDSSTPEELAGVLRLVHLYGFFRRTVICASPSLPAGTINAVQAAYTSGVQDWQVMREEITETTGTLSFGLVMFDETPDGHDPEIALRACDDDDFA